MEVISVEASSSGFRFPHAWKKAQRVVTVLAVMAILAATYVWTGIDPMKLWQKRHNAWNYLFGRNLTDHEIQEARQMAERMVEVVVTQNILQELKERATTAKTSTDTASLLKEAKKLAAEQLALMPAAKRQAMIDKEFHRLVDEKRGGFFPPQTNLTSVTTYVLALLETVAIAIWGSLLAVLWALPVSFLAARNGLGILFPGDEPFYRAFRGAAYFTTRRVLDFCRGFNEFVMALVFVAVIGLGPFAGVMALAIHTFGILGKLFSETIEAVDPGQVEALSATGAGPLQILAFSVLPQVMPQVISYSLLRFESNVRSATILGFCGAGGIGFLMFDKLNSYQYRDVATMMALVILAVTIIDSLCSKARHRFI